MLDDILYKHHERKVGQDNCVQYLGLTLQIPADRCRCRYVKVRIRVPKYPGGPLSAHHGPRELARHDAHCPPLLKYADATANDQST